MPHSSRRLPATVLVVALVLAACSPPDPVGHYSTEGTQLASEVPEGAPAFVQEEIAKGADAGWKIDLEIAADHTFAMTLRPPEAGLQRSGTWSQSGDTLTLETEGGAAPGQEATLEGNRLHLRVSAGSPRIVLVRRGSP